MLVIMSHKASPLSNSTSTTSDDGDCDKIVELLIDDPDRCSAMLQSQQQLNYITRKQVKVFDMLSNFMSFVFLLSPIKVDV